MSKMVTRLSEIQVDHKGICKGCAEGKSLKRPFPSSKRKDKGILDIVHSNICGPMSTSPSNGYVYYVSFIDGFSCKAWIYFLKSKVEVFIKFKEFKTLIENLSRHSMGKLGLRGSSLLHTILSKMMWQKERTKP
jgi:hypothetical protein